MVLRNSGTFMGVSRVASGMQKLITVLLLFEIWFVS